MKRCPYCSAQIADDSLFCEVCGKKQPQGRVCNECGMPVNDGDVFCGNCGHKIGEEVKAAPVGKKCPHCGGAVEEEDVFCQTCGKKMDAPRKWPAPSVQEIVRYECKHCGKEMEDDYIACDDYILCKECWAAEFEELEKEHAEQTQQAEAAEPKVVEEEKNSLKVVVIVLVCVAILIGGGLLYKSCSAQKDLAEGEEYNAGTEADNGDGEATAEEVETDSIYEVKVAGDYDHIGDFIEGFAYVKKGEKTGFIDKNGKEVLPCIYENVGDFDEGFAEVEKNGKYGYVKSGKEVVPCIYENVGNFH